MDENKIKEFMLRMEGFAEGIKFGNGETIKWFLNQLKKEEDAKKEEKPQTGE